ncbi:hypothetical protein FB451DRAFT_584811 [Mycena latifolia]|nr:hypothetical protein FB451DRAFT_584811 [Mycena latifolia]
MVQAALVDDMDDELHWPPERPCWIILTVRRTMSAGILLVMLYAAVSTYISWWQLGSTTPPSRAEWIMCLAWVMSYWLYSHDRPTKIWQLVDGTLAILPWGERMTNSCCKNLTSST